MSLNEGNHRCVTLCSVELQPRCQSVFERVCTAAPCTHLLAVLGRVHPVVQAGLARQPEGLLEQVLGDVLEGESEDKVAHPSVLFLGMKAEVDEVLDVVVATNVLQLLARGEREHFWGFLQMQTVMRHLPAHLS